MEKRDLHSPDLAARNVEKIAALFPSVITEAADADGNIVRSVDFDLLRQELSDHIVEGPQERYRLDWPGKRAAAFAANAPIAKTLRPMREESVDFDTTKNLFIEGDNLDALKLLQESYLGKVKLIYIDPPYNTGNDFVYSDTFADSRAEELQRSGQTENGGVALVSNPNANGRFHTTWLNMLYPRLRLARNLLSDDGILVVSIDENEHASLVRMGEEILGSSSYVGEIVLKNSSRNDQAYIAMQHEYVVFFVRNREVNPGVWREKKGGLDKIYAAFDGFKRKHGENWAAISEEAKAWFKQFPPSDPVSASKHYTWMDERGVYFPDNISGPNDGQYVYDIPHPVTKQNVKRPGRGWVSPRESLEAKILDGRVHFGPDHETVPKLKTYLANTEYQSLTSIRYVDGRAASKRLSGLFGEKVFTNPKDELLLRDIYRAVGVADGDIVLDMFAGSGSAMHAAWELRATSGVDVRFIGIQVAESLTQSLKTAKGAARQITSNAIQMLGQLNRPATVAEITKERLRRVSRQMVSAGSTGDFGFRVVRVDSTGLTDVGRVADAVDQDLLLSLESSVKPDRSGEDLLFQVLLDWGLDLTVALEALRIEETEILAVDDDALIACFAEEVTPELVRTIAVREPLRAVFRDSGFATDAARINAEQIFREVSPATEVRTI